MDKKKSTPITAVAGKATAKTVTRTTKLPAIKDSTNLTNQGIILIKHAAMQEIYKNSGPDAVDNEFQVSYWSLNFRFRANDNSILDICIPTCYFNYKQEVTSVHIDFKHDEVGQLSDKLLPLHNAKVQELLPLSSELASIFGVQFETTSVGLNTIHRHPGSSTRQGFSGTDYCKDAEGPGVVFPIGNAAPDQPNFAGIMAIDSGKCNVAHYEYRIVNGKLGEDINYQKGRCAAIIDKPAKQLSSVERMMGVKTNSSILYKLQNTEETETLSLVADLWANTNFEPDTRAIDPANVVAKSYKFPSTNTTRYAQTTISNFSNPFMDDTDPELEEAKRVVETYKTVDIKDKMLLGNMNRAQLLIHYQSLELVYYGQIDPEEAILNAKLSKEQLIEQIDELQDTMIDEYNDAFEFIKDYGSVSQTGSVLTPLTVEEMKHCLIAFGTPPTMLKTADDNTIRRWYQEATK